VAAFFISVVAAQHAAPFFLFSALLRVLSVSALSLLFLLARSKNIFPPRAMKFTPTPIDAHPSSAHNALTKFQAF
jgi:hypothetical protein